MTKSVFQRLIFALLPIVMMWLCCSCSPTIYIIDQPTRMELDAAGSWPDFEEALVVETLGFRPTPLPPSARKAKRKAPYRLIAGDFLLSDDVANETKQSGVEQ